MTDEALKRIVAQWLDDHTCPGGNGASVVLLHPYGARLRAMDAGPDKAVLALHGELMRLVYECIGRAVAHFSSQERT